MEAQDILQKPDIWFDQFIIHKPRCLILEEVPERQLSL